MGAKKVKPKAEREVEFNVERRTSARELLWHLKRIHHWWNCQGASNTTEPLEIQI